MRKNAMSRRSWLIGLILILTVNACSNGNEKTSDSELVIKPRDLFAGQAIKFKNFMPMESGSVDLHYEGNRKEIRFIVEIWKSGKKSEGMSYGEFTKERKGGKRSLDGELIYMLDPKLPAGSNTHNIDAAISFINDKNRSKAGATIESGLKITGHGHIQLHEAVRITDGEEAYIGGMTAATGDRIQSAGLSVESLKQAEYAVVYKVSLK